MQILKTIRPVISGIVALVSCPCHLPLTLPILLSLTAGTVFGMWLGNNVSWVVGISTVLFLVSLVLTYRWSTISQSHALPIQSDQRSETSSYGA
ncbi:MAG: hypothetical protein GC179_18490 [Anaerolineaceae bacterium]|nr:hypothetical protein [Anaerolineaceae bacterium]